MKKIFPLGPGFFFSLQKLLLSSFFILFTIILVAIFYWFYTFVTQAAMEQLKKDLAQSALTVALKTNGDEVLALSQNGQPNTAGTAWRAANAGGDREKQATLSRYGPINQAGFSDDPRYRRMLDWFDTVHQIEPRAWPYTWVYGTDEKELFYVVDLMARYNPVKSTLFLDRQTSRQPPIQDGIRFSVDRGGNLISNQDQWGRWYSAWIPLKNAAGVSIGGIGVDFEAGEVEQVQQVLRDEILIVFGITYLILFLVVFWISRIVTRPIGALNKAATLVGEGHYEQEFSALYRGHYFYNEVDVLARVFEIMVGKVYQREQTLQHQVNELRIEINVARQKQQVAEIVESDFFHDLQIKARDMRGRRAAEGTSSDENQS